MRSSILSVTTTVSLETFESPGFYDDLQRVQTNAVLQPVNLSRALVSLFGGVVGIVILGESLLLDRAAAAARSWPSAGIPQVFLSRRQGAMDFDFVVKETAGHRVRDYLLEVLTGRDEAKEIRAFDLGSRPGGALGQQLPRATWTAMRQHVGQRVRLARRVVAGHVRGHRRCRSALLVYFVVEDRIGLASAGAALIAIRLLATRIELAFTGVTALFESQPVPPGLRALPGAPARARGGAAASHADSGAAVHRAAGRERLVPLPAEPRRRLARRVDEHPRRRGRGAGGRERLGQDHAGQAAVPRVHARPAGRVTWDGVDAATLPAQELRRHIGIIFQDFVRYQLTAHENIAFGRADALDDREGVIAAAQRGGAHEYLEALPDGYDTMLGKTFWGGYDLSLGQWQRVAIARAFFREASFLVLDEPTASLDARSEQRLFEQLGELAEGRALLLISHRFSTVRSADRIFVLHHGEVIEQGSHDELIARDGHYAELFAMQARSYR